MLKNILTLIFGFIILLSTISNAFIPTFSLEKPTEWQYVKVPYKNNKFLLEESDNGFNWHFEALTSFHYQSPSLNGINFDLKIKYQAFAGMEFNYVDLKKKDNNLITKYKLYSLYYIPITIPSQYSAFEIKLGLKHLEQEEIIYGYAFGFNYELLPKKPVTFNLSMEHVYLDERPFYDFDWTCGFYWKKINFFLGYRYLSSKTLFLSGTHAGIKYNF
ncbi:MAG: hypothetical protein PHX78_01010 [bacterium]|nr:hypothetical protein [bacterium]